MNQVKITFIECKPAPPKGYDVYWKILGSAGAYSFLGTFFSSPVVFFDNSVSTTNYEGVIISELSNMSCTPVHWSTVGGGGGSGGSGGGSGGSGGGPIGNPILASLAVTEPGICGIPQQTLYLNPPHTMVETGAYLYYNAQLTSHVTGYLFVADDTNTFHLDISTGRVLNPTGNAC